jgi:hypothetical protein
VREQLLRARPVRHIRRVSRKRLLERGDGTFDRARVRARMGVVAHDLLEQAVHAGGVVIDARKAQTRERIEGIQEPLALDRDARVDQDVKQGARDRVRGEMRGERQQLAGERRARARGLYRCLPRRGDGLGVGDLGTAIEQLLGRQCVQQFEIVSKARALRAVGGGVRERQRQVPQCSSKPLRAGAVTRPLRALHQIAGRGLGIEHVERQHRRELPHLPIARGHQQPAVPTAGETVRELCGRLHVVEHEQPALLAAPETLKRKIAPLNRREPLHRLAEPGGEL